MGCDQSCCRERDRFAHRRRCHQHQQLVQFKLQALDQLRVAGPEVPASGVRIRTVEMRWKIQKLLVKETRTLNIQVRGDIGR